MSTFGPDVRAVLQVGGKGQRLRPATSNVPKPLIKVGGIPMVERLLRQLVVSGFRSVIVITGSLGDLVEDHLQGLEDLPDDLRLDFIREPRPMGNVGALAYLPQSPEPVLFAFGDLVTDLDFARLMEVHAQKGGDATLTSHYETHQLTLGELLTQEDEVTGYQEKPLKQFLICSGIAVFEPSVLQLLDSSRPLGLSDLIVAALNEGLRIVHWTHGAFWMDINTPEALDAVERKLARRSEGH